MNPAFGVALIPSLYGYAAHTTYHCAEAAYVSISLRIITPLYIPIEGCVLAGEVSRSELLEWIYQSQQLHRIGPAAGTGILPLQMRSRLQQ